MNIRKKYTKIRTLMIIYLRDTNILDNISIIREFIDTNQKYRLNNIIYDLQKKNIYTIATLIDKQIEYKQ